jgi:hypothetical protein
MLILFVLGPPLKTILLEKVKEKKGMNDWQPESRKVRVSFTKRLHFLEQKEIKLY